MEDVTIKTLMPYILSCIDKLNNHNNINRGAWDITAKITLSTLFKHLYILVTAFPEYVMCREKFRNLILKKTKTVIDKTELKDQKVRYYALKTYESCHSLMDWEENLGIYNRLKIAGVRDDISKKISAWIYPRDKIKQDGPNYYRVSDKNTLLIV